MNVTADSVWTAADTTPDAIEAALRAMLKERHSESASYVPARTLNLVCVVDKQWSGEIANRLRHVGGAHAARTIVCAVEPRRSAIDAVATIASDVHPRPGEFALLRETVVVDVGEQHLSHLDTIVDPLVVTDLPTVLWAPHGHQDAVGALIGLAQVVLLDSVDEPDLRDALSRALRLLDDVYVVDLAWLRSTPWRERVAATFDPRGMREALRHISGVTVRYRPDSEASAFLYVGWLASRLGWRVGTLAGSGNGLHGHARARRQEVELHLQHHPEQDVPGLAGVTVETASGLSISLDRAAGGLTEHRRETDGSEHTWKVLGASRGEGGILGQGVRQALLRDPTYKPALDAARAMLP